ncbi:MAG: protein kinase, partial [Anaerolineales bacterium]
MEKELIGGRYQVLQQIGGGGMANVYLSRDLNLQRQVAVKQLRHNFADDAEFRVRFLQEARAAANLVHPNIVTIYDFGRDPQDIYIVMEYVEGTDLKTLLRRRSPLPHPEAVRLILQICDGVGYAHRAGLVHCDLKPQNILISNSERIKITDFGIS